METGRCTQVSGAFVRKYILGLVYLLACCFLDKETDFPEFCGAVIFGFAESNETKAEWCSSHLNSIHLRRSFKFSMIVVGLFELFKQLL